MGAKKRLQFDFSEEGYAKLERLREQMDAGSHAEVVRRGLGLLDYARDRASHGCILIVREEDGTEREIVVV